VTLVKSASKKNFSQKTFLPIENEKVGFLGRTFFGSVCTFYEMKSPKWKQPLNISFFYKEVLEFHRPSTFFCQTSRRQNHWSLARSLREIVLQTVGQNRILSMKFWSDQ
jgi:hypothetical protein